MEIQTSILSCPICFLNQVYNYRIILSYTACIITSSSWSHLMKWSLYFLLKLFIIVLRHRLDPCHEFPFLLSVPNTYIASKIHVCRVQMLMVDCDSFLRRHETAARQSDSFYKIYKLYIHSIQLS